MKHKMFEDTTPAALCACIDCWVRGRHAQRNRSIMKDRLLHGYTFEQLAEMHDLSVRQVKNIVYRHESVICDKITSEFE